MQVTSLARIRHPNFIKVIEPLDESRKAIVMITEPVIGSLANAFKDYTNLPRPGADVASYSPETPEVQSRVCAVH